MGNDAKGRYLNVQAVTVQASVTKTATFTGASYELGDRGVLRATLAVTAHAGTTPTLDVAVQTSADGTTWRAVGSFTQVTTTNGTERKSFAGCDRYVRAVATIAGTTPSYTYAVTGDAV